MKKWTLLFIMVILTMQNVQSDCILKKTVQSDRIANYEMEIVLDEKRKLANARQTLTWKNISPDTIHELRFYMYLNGFKNMESTFLKGSGGMIFGEDITKRKESEWGWINVNKVTTPEGVDLTEGMRYIQLDDWNEKDESVLQIPLKSPVLPGDSLVLDMDFTAKMPRIIARAGYSNNDYFLFVHWFPQIGVYEKDRQGDWGWNCRQFYRRGEFYANFGVYDVKITAADHLVIGASGCRVSDSDNEDGTRTLRYIAEDVIDFAWTVYPDFEEYNDQWNDISIRLLIPEEHASLSPRILKVAKQAMAYLHEHVGPYPYPTITIVDPPMHAIRSGLMEYPMLITCGSFYRWPSNIRTVESLVVHEYAHMYFMATVASNEKEEAWLDEGFVTYFEDRIMDHYYGEDIALFDILGYKSGNRENTRLEYTGMPNPSVSSILRPSWEFTEGYRELVYSKAAIVLQTLEGLVGEEVMDEIMKIYFERWKFRHPRTQDFIDIVNEVVKKENVSHIGENMDWFFEECLSGTGVCDYKVAEIVNDEIILDLGLYGEPGKMVHKEGGKSDLINSGVRVERLGELIFPVEIVLKFENGETIVEHWDGKETSKWFRYQSATPLVSAYIDPEKRIYLDIDFNNNSKTLKPDKTPLWKYTVKGIFWLQNILNYSGAMM